MTDPQQITVDFTPGEGAVGRIVGLVERRGFELRGLAMHDRDGRASMTLDLIARDAGRRLDVLDLQLRRLIGVHHVSTSPATGKAQ